MLEVHVESICITVGIGLESLTVSVGGFSGSYAAPWLTTTTFAIPPFSSNSVTVAAPPTPGVVVFSLNIIDMFAGLV